MTPPNRFVRGCYLAVLASSTVLSVVGGIIAGAVHGAWKWMGVPAILGVLLAAEIYAAVRRERRDMELEELVGPLPEPWRVRARETAAGIDQMDREIAKLLDKEG